MYLNMCPYSQLAVVFRELEEHLAVGGLASRCRAIDLGIQIIAWPLFCFLTPDVRNCHMCPMAPYLPHLDS